MKAACTSGVRLALLIVLLACCSFVRPWSVKFDPSEDDLQALLSLTAAVHPKDPTWNATTAACSWAGVVCRDTAHVPAVVDARSPSRAVVEINFSDLGLSGLLNLTRLPHLLQRLSISNAMLKSSSSSSSFGVLRRERKFPAVSVPWRRLGGFTGPLDFSNLPPSLSYIDLSGNQFSGHFPVAAPCCKGLKELFMHYNHFSSVNLTVLPPSLQVLTLFGNQLVGQSVGLQLDALPRGMKELDLAWNAELQGPLNLTALPPTMSVLNLYGNKFGGRLDLGHLPLNLTWLALEANHGAPRFCGEGDVSPPQVCRSIFLGGACHVNCVNASFNCGIC